MIYDEFLYKLRIKQNFSFSRWGDGELNCMLQIRPGKANCDGNYYYPELGKALSDIIDRKPDYYLGIQPLAKRIYPDEANRMMLNGSEWIDADILHSASITGRLEELFMSLEDRDIIVVGPLYLMKVWGERAKLVKTVENNCWNERQYLMALLTDILMVKKDCVVLFSAGMAANYLVDELYKKFGEQHTLIDAGSVFDPYCGRNSRKYHSQIIERLNDNTGSNIKG